MRILLLGLTASEKDFKEGEGFFFCFSLFASAVFHLRKSIYNSLQMACLRPLTEKGSVCGNAEDCPPSIGIFIYCLITVDKLQGCFSTQIWSV